MNAFVIWKLGSVIVILYPLDLMAILICLYKVLRDTKKSRVIYTNSKFLVISTSIKAIIASIVYSECLVSTRLINTFIHNPFLCMPIIPININPR